MLNTAHALSLEPLYRRRVFQSTRKVDCHAQVANELSEHDLFWKGDNVDTVLFKAAIQQLQIFMLKYGAEVIVRPRLFNGFALVHMTLSGNAEIESDGQKVCIPQGKTALIAPKRNLRLWWQAGSEQLILKVPLALFEELSTVGQPGAVDVPSLFLLPQQAAPHWDLLIQSLLRVLALPGQGAGQGEWIRHFERSAAQFLLSQLTSTMPSAPACSDAQRAAGQAADSLVGAGKLQRMDMLERYIRSRLCAPLALADLAGAAGVSERALNALCHQQYGVAPMDLLRNIRLDAVRERLLTQPGANVTDTAFEFGFGHLGRFSAYYRERFGELPSQTRGVAR
ncbi:AraC family transcriptional regulator [Herbaspirillum rubrisubalbicans]|jgi:AraC-like DNA-binding protein|uniref:AraC family transcriptional regulator n=2 Tax=Herbaspirillum rubrisubalbicans TaxID=80842 RepID=A0ABX9BUQ3_9BURK|nr:MULTISPECIES: AraC family transcriptional regulator [Herbaspirillum]NQE49391.1 AraC family transcriptional regulator [Herbaspirillum rubrisubalbicans]QJQ02646.1 AraC family transcriptional regulator [Herbaspirillum rubrisubalbicans Os34]RAM61491.1 AraC family transcriptional regulator [Herbaspirillum rubrisubalbicans]RAN43587.1 AraC family transcriptional regulator [Herbaspirillum rubrisubalbicans]